MIVPEGLYYIVLHKVILEVDICGLKIFALWSKFFVWDLEEKQSFPKSKWHSIPTQIESDFFLPTAPAIFLIQCSLL